MRFPFLFLKAYKCCASTEAILNYSSLQMLRLYRGYFELL